MFEALARGCAIISEKLNQKVIKDLNLEGVIIEVESPKDLKEKLKFYNKNLNLIKEYQEKSKESIFKNTWNYRFKEVKNKILEILDIKP